ncbi:MAG: NADP-dependent phosphogluconate dehydrogenase [Geminicoccaceae bacterium]|nr:NADP-dependent phosphogluconate dehydrogenase [Geminicoccaceae bacterium]
MQKTVIGILGLGVMGRNLALNLGDHGHDVRGFDRDAEAVRRAREAGIGVEDDLDALLEALSPAPRIVLLSVPAGDAVDAALGDLGERLDPGDIIVDSGNSHFGDTGRRTAALAERGIHLAGTGVSGGEEGARHGPSIMAGGDEAACARLMPVLTSIAARFGDEPCCAWMGPGGAGHFVKMVHNGIEYADMQLIAECWLLMRDVLGLDAAAASRVFLDWNRGELASYLIEITAEILAMTDRSTGAPILDIIADRAGHKGTGQWTARASLELGVPAPTIIAAVGARALSAATGARAVLSKGERKAGGEGKAQCPRMPDTDTLAGALLCARISAYAQGFMILDAARVTHGWPLDFERIAAIWRAGCIIRARLLGPIMQAAASGPGPAGLAAASPTREMAAGALPALREAVLAGTACGVPVPALTSALGWLDGLHAGNVGASLIQAQRDRFGAHGFARTDREGTHHLEPAGG